MSRLFALSLAGLAAAALALPLSAADTKKSEKNIVETAKSAGQFETLLTAAKAAGLAETLSNDGPFTVFAPTDEAFAKLPKGTLDKLLKDKEQLKQILLYHVVKGKVTSKQVVELDSADTLAEQKVAIKVDGSTVMVGEAKVVKADVMASNGVIHVIDAVLIPEAKESE